VIADCPENLFSPHDLCEESHERRMVVRVQALSEAVDDNPQTKKKRLVELMAFQTNALGTFQEGHCFI
jgi:hypothetical protein